MGEIIQELQPGAEHRFCCRHLYNNLRKKHPGALIHELFWKAAAATYLLAHERVMDELKSCDVEAFKWVDEVPRHKWCRHAFSGHAKTDTLLNNLCEGFNSTILEAREKPIVSMMEEIRLYLMNRFRKNRENIEKVEGDLCPVIKKRLTREQRYSANWIPKWSGELKYEVKSIISNESFSVDLSTRECTCRKWTLTGIPCSHAISCITFNKEDVTKYVSDYFRVSTYKRCYAPLIYPVNGPNMWAKTGLPPIQPPPRRRPTGRPKKQRRREADEPKKGTKLVRRGTTVACKRCGRTGHNRRTCKGLVGGNKELDKNNASAGPSRVNKRKVKASTLTHLLFIHLI